MTPDQIALMDALNGAIHEAEEAGDEGGPRVDRILARLNEADWFLVRGEEVATQYEIEHRYLDDDGTG